MKKRYWSLTLAGLLWAFSSAGTVLSSTSTARGEVADSGPLDVLGIELRSVATTCHMGLELEPNG